MIQTAQLILHPRWQYTYVLNTIYTIQPGLVIANRRLLLNTYVISMKFFRLRLYLRMFGGTDAERRTDECLI